MSWSFFLLMIQVLLLCSLFIGIGYIIRRLYKRFLRQQRNKKLTRHYIRQFELNPNELTHVLRDTAYKFSVIQVLGMSAVRKTAQYHEKYEEEELDVEAEQQVAVAVQLHIINDHLKTIVDALNEIHDTYEVVIKEIENGVLSEDEIDQPTDRKIISLEDYRRINKDNDNN